MRDSFEVDLDHAEAILPRYLAAGPRYTSYPTAPAWSDAYGADQFHGDLAACAAQAAEPLSLYVHVPFCLSLCHFCACNRVITQNPELPARFLDAIEREVALVREAVGVERSASQLHWGGGTPTHLQPDQIRRLYRAVTDAFPMRRGAEISIEVDPRVTTAEHVEALRECGFNRISLGVQDFDARVQAAIHRTQPARQTAALVDASRCAGFESVNLDMIYGLPYQTEESFDRTLETVLAIAPDRIALYSYAHVTWVAKQQRGFERKDLPGPALKLRIMLMAIRRLVAAGYVYVGLDHFARPGDELVRALEEQSLRRNFMGYTTLDGTDLIGFGPSAISELRGSYAQSHRDLTAWEQSVGAGRLATVRGHALSEDDRTRRWLIRAIMCQGEVSASRYRQAFAADLVERHAPELEQLRPLERDGLVVCAPDGSLRVTSLGRLLVRNVAMVFDAYLLAQHGAGQPLFSKTV